jgi:formate-nitrite transporter family protein
MDSIKNSSNLPLIITIVFTVVLMVVGIIVLSKTSTKPLSQDEKEQRLVRTDSHIKGKTDSKVTIVEFSDFECPACGKYYTEFNKIEQNYQDRVKIVYRHFPLNSIHPLAQKAAEASEAAGAQEKFWEYNSMLFEKQAEWSSLSKDQAIVKFIEFAQQINIKDLNKFETELKNGTYADRVTEDANDAKALNLPGTPTVFLNAEQQDNPSYDNLSKEIDKLLQ